MAQDSAALGWDSGPRLLSVLAKARYTSSSASKSKSRQGCTAGKCHQRKHSQNTAIVPTRCSTMLLDLRPLPQAGSGWRWTTSAAAASSSAMGLTAAALLMDATSMSPDDRSDSTGAHCSFAAASCHAAPAASFARTSRAPGSTSDSTAQQVTEDADVSIGAAAVHPDRLSKELPTNEGEGSRPARVTVIAGQLEGVCGCLVRREAPGCQLVEQPANRADSVSPGYTSVNVANDSACNRATHKMCKQGNCR